MKNTQFCLCLFLLSGIFIFNACQPAPCTLSEEDKASFSAKTEADETKWNSGDRDGYMMRYAEDALFLPANTEALQGREAIKAWHMEFPEIKIAFEVKEVRGTCDFATVYGTYVLTTEDGIEVDRGKWLEVQQKQADGSWIITQDIFNSDIPLPEPAEDATADAVDS